MLLPLMFTTLSTKPQSFTVDNSKNKNNYYIITVFFLNVVGKAFWLDVGFVLCNSIDDEVEINIVGFVLWNSVEG